LFFWSLQLLVIPGTRVSGLNDGHTNLPLQLPHITPDFRELENCHRATINVKLESPLIVATPDHRTKPIPWHKNFPNGESFDFLRIQFEPSYGAPLVKAWLYIAHGSPHRNDLRIHEVITERLDLTDDPRCRIHIDRWPIWLPYTAFRAAIV
jgi:hypothetical protein